MEYKYYIIGVMIVVMLTGCASNEKKRFFNSDEYELALVEIQNRDYLKELEIDSNNLDQLRTASYYFITDERAHVDALMDYMEDSLTNHENIELNRINDIWELNGRRPKLIIQNDSIIKWETLLTRVGYKFDCKLTNWDFIETPIQEIFVNPETRPIWPGCEHDDQPNRCSDKEFMHYFMDRFKYPSMDAASEFSDRIIVEFIITADGNVKDVAVRRGMDLAKQSNVIEILRSMPNWIPGKMYNRPVPIKLTFPIRVHFE